MPAAAAMAARARSTSDADDMGVNPRLSTAFAALVPATKYQMFAAWLGAGASAPACDALACPVARSVAQKTSSSLPNSLGYTSPGRLSARGVKGRAGVSERSTRDVGCARARK